ncbi:MAG TPA: hypothetical protein VF041_23235 [Gemmatimonadaceae bacterium]
MVFICAICKAEFAALSDFIAHLEEHKRENRRRLVALDGEVARYRRYLEEHKKRREAKRKGWRRWAGGG